MKVVIYVRVSTDKQDTDPQSYELKRYCDGREWEHPIIVTDIISGSAFDRNGLNEVMHMVRNGKADVVVVAKLDRLGRSLQHLAQIIHELTSHNVALVIPSQGIDTSHSNPAAKLQLHVLCAVAEFEREVIRERVMAGLAVAKSNGVRFGRKEKLSKHVGRISELRSQGKSVRGIATELRMPSSSVFKVLNSL